MKPGEKPTHLDLFSGIGGFGFAFERAGFRTIAFCENDHYPSAVLKKHWPDVPNYGDVSKLCRRIYDCEPRNGDEVFCPRCNTDFEECPCVGTDQFTDTHGFPDVITGGFPCQDISNAGTTHEGGLKGLDGARSGLWFEYFRIVRELMPRVVLVENVPVVRVRGADRICADLESVGYAVQPFVAGVWAAGGQVKGDRAWFVGIQKTERAGLEGDVLQKMERESERGQYSNPARSDWGRASSRLRGSPDGVPGWMGQIKCYGNSISPQVAEVFARGIYQILKK